MTTKLIRGFALACALAAGVAFTSGDAKAQFGFGYPGSYGRGYSSFGQGYNNYGRSFYNPGYSSFNRGFSSFGARPGFSINFGYSSGSSFYRRPSYGYSRGGYGYGNRYYGRGW